MSAMAGELDVNRVTLYRWIGSREAVLVDIVWGLAEQTLADVDAAVRGRGAERVVAIVTRFVEAGDRQPRHAALAGRRGRARDAAAHALGPRLPAAADRLGRGPAWSARSVELDADRREVAYVIVRVIESYTYLDLILGERPDARRAEPILRLLLR